MCFLLVWCQLFLPDYCLCSTAGCFLLLKESQVISRGNLWVAHNSEHTCSCADTWMCTHTRINKFNSLFVQSSTVVQAWHTNPSQLLSRLNNPAKEKWWGCVLGEGLKVSPGLQCVCVCLCRTGKGETAGSEVYHNHYSAQGREEM